MITSKIGNRIRELRKKEGISQEKLAFKADLDRTYIAGVESGKRNVSVKTLKKILDALGITFEDFFKGTNCWLKVTKCDMIGDMEWLWWFKILLFQIVWN